MEEQSLSPEIADDEFLYRGISNHQWDFQNNRITSAAFKDSLGVSVDRSGNRNNEACISRLLQTKPFYAIGRLLVSYVREKSLLVKYLPTEYNEYHSEIHHSLTRVELTTGQARALSQSATVVYQQEGTIESDEPKD